MERWYALVKKTPGEAVSFGTDTAEPLPPHLEAVAIDHQPARGERWDAASRTLQAVPESNPLRDEYAASTTTDQKIDVVAKAIGLR